MGPERLSVYHKDHIAVDALFQKPLQEIVIVIPPPAGRSDLFVVSQCTANRVA